MLPNDELLPAVPICSVTEDSYERRLASNMTSVELEGEFITSHSFMGCAWSFEQGLRILRESEAWGGHVHSRYLRLAMYIHSSPHALNIMRNTPSGVTPSPGRAGFTTAEVWESCSMMWKCWRICRRTWGLARHPMVIFDNCPKWPSLLTFFVLILSFVYNVYCQ